MSTPTEPTGQNETSKPPAIVHLTYRSCLVALPITAPSAGALERAIDALLARPGWAAPAPEKAPPEKAPPAEKVAPVYQPDGTACCPVHLRGLAQGSYGLYCPTKARPGEQANAKGYCALRFAE